MKLRQYHFFDQRWVNRFADPAFQAADCQLVLAFGSPDMIVKPTVYDFLKQEFPAADIIFSSTAGEIIDENVFDETIVVTAVQFEKSGLKAVSTNISNHQNSFEAGAFLMNALSKDDLKVVFVVSDGTYINGSELIAGFNANRKDEVLVTGGLAGDGDRFSATFTGINAIPTQGNVIAIGFYGESLVVNHGSNGGWDEFGPERTITRSVNNVLYEIDGKNALDLYKEYLGDYAKELPGSALLFPLSLKIERSGHNLVRTILSVSEEEKSMTFAGDLPEGGKVRLMKANYDKLIEASSAAAKESALATGESPALAILISCVGRKLVLNERTDEELTAAKEALGDNAVITGFYSYGELSPLLGGSDCELHNQTMTITTFAENIS
jgi:hypothetical protein